MDSEKFSNFFSSYKPYIFNFLVINSWLNLSSSYI
jgi:hypothetical protein